jgi:carbamoyltransferase
MYVLGIGTHVTCGSAIIKDGKVIAAINDERLVRKKMVFGFPRKSILQLLEISNITPDDIDYVAVATKRQHLVNKYVDYLGGKFKHKRGIAKHIFFDAGSRLSKYLNRFPILEDLYYFLRQPFFIFRRKKIRSILKNEFDINCPVEFMEHHLCHAASAFYSSQYNEATAITLDSAGDGLSSQVYHFSNNKHKKFNEVSSFNSPSSFYSYVTQICGFKAGKHEGKITGLAAYGEPNYLKLFKELILYKDGKFKNIGGVFFQSALKSIKNALPPDYKKEDLAATIQHYLEEMVVEYTKYWLEKTGGRNAVLAGGVFANVLINQKIHEIPLVESVYIHPGMSDEGIGLGAALSLYYEKSNADKIVCFDHVYLGLEFNNEEILKELEKEALEYQYHDNVEKEIASLLASGYVVARFNGRMEYGPRALGNRSILYQPIDPSVNDWLNKGLRRTEFMPFAPATLEEDTDKCYIGVKGAVDTARFMTITFGCTDWMKENCAGVVHIDGTARPQLVNEEDNPSYYRIIKEYKKLTGLGTIINTSFNIHEEPIVCTPSDAIRAFNFGYLDYLAIGNFIVKSKHEVIHPLIVKESKIKEEVLAE